MITKILWVPFRYVAYAVLLFVFGFISSLINMSVQVSFMKTTPNEYIGRAGSIFNAAACSSIPVASFVLAAVLPWSTIVNVYFFTGLMTIVIFLFLGSLKPIRQIDRDDETLIPEKR